LFECFAVAVPSLFGYLFSFFPRGLLLLFEGFLCGKQRGKKKEEEVEERKEFCGVKKEAGGGR
jgi:hypothetical protein